MYEKASRVRLSQNASTICSVWENYLVFASGCALFMNSSEDGMHEGLSILNGNIGPVSDVIPRPECQS